MSKIRYGRGAASIVMEDTVERMVRAVLEQSQGAVLRSVERVIDLTYLPAFHRWPVRSGKSKALLDHYVAVMPTKIIGVVTTTSKYAYYIRTKRRDGIPVKHVWTELVKKPFKKWTQMQRATMTKAILDAHKVR